MKMGLMILVLMTGSVWSQDQMALRINEQGLMRILELGLKYTTSEEGKRAIVIPQNIYKLSLHKNKIHSNPIIPVIDKFTTLDLSQEIPFYLKTSDINVLGQIELQSFKSSIENSHPGGFDIKVSLRLQSIHVDAKEISLCEKKKCSALGLKASLKKVKIKSKSEPVSLTFILRLQTQNDMASVQVVSVDTNLGQKNGPKLDISFSKIEVPEILLIDETGEEIKLNISTDEIKKKIIEQKDFLSQKLLSFTADFIANDLAEMLNRYLMDKHMATSLKVFCYDDKVIDMSDSAMITYADDETYRDLSPMENMFNQVYQVIRNAQVGLSLEKISAPRSKDLELMGKLNFIMNKKPMAFKNSLGNSSRTLPPLSLEEHREHDINLAISEPVLNSALDVVTSTGLFQRLFDFYVNYKGVDINNIKVHFKNNNSFVIVANLMVSLAETEAVNFSAQIKKLFGQYLEEEGTQGTFFFPVEIEVIPHFIQNPEGAGLYLEVLSPFTSKGLINSFNYPSNVHHMTDTVRDILFNALKSSLDPLTNKFYNIDLSKLLNEAGVVFRPKSISIEKSAYLLLNADIKDIHFNAKNKSKNGCVP